MNSPTNVLVTLPLMRHMPGARLLMVGQALLAFLVAALLATV